MFSRLFRAAFIGAALFLTLSGCAGDSSAAPQEQFPAPTLTEAERQINDFIAAGRAPGVIIEVTAGDRKWAKGYGLADKQKGIPMSIGLQTRIGSITKTFTTTLALLLVKEGKLKLDEPISHYISGIPKGDKITVRMLGDMTAGLPEYLANPAFRDAFFSHPNRVWTPYELLEYAWSSPDPGFEPGTSSSYSNANTVVLGLVIERVTGKPFEQALRERVLRTNPYLADTLFPTNELFPNAHVQGYFASFADRPEADSTYWSPSQAWSAGQMISTVQNLTAWVRLVGSGALVGPELQAQRLKWKPIGDNNQEWHYTFGLEENSGWLGHNGEIPGFDTFAVYHPQLDATIVIAINTDKRIGSEPPINVLMRNLSKVFFPEHPVRVPVVG